MQLSNLLAFAFTLNSCAGATGNWTTSPFNISVSSDLGYIACAARSVSSAKLRYDEASFSVFSDYGDEFAIYKGRLVDLSQPGPRNYVEATGGYQESFMLTDFNSTKSTWAVTGDGSITFNGKSDFYIEFLSH